MEASPKPAEVERDFRVVEAVEYPSVEYPLFYVPGIVPPPVRNAPELGISIDLVVQNKDRGIMHKLEPADLSGWLECLREDAKILIYNGNLEEPKAKLTRINFERAILDPRTINFLTARDNAENAEGRFAGFLKLLDHEFNGKPSVIPVGEEEG